MEKISATKLVRALTNKGTRATVTFIKKDNTRRTMECIPNEVDELGYLNVNELPTGNPRKIDTRNLISATVGNKEYVVQA